LFYWFWFFRFEGNLEVLIIGDWHLILQSDLHIAGDKVLQLDFITCTPSKRAQAEPLAAALIEAALIFKGNS